VVRNDASGQRKLVEVICKIVRRREGASYKKVHVLPRRENLEGRRRHNVRIGSVVEDETARRPVGLGNGETKAHPAGFG
jgi:hypothetical protein